MKLARTRNQFRSSYVGMTSYRFSMFRINGCIGKQRPVWRSSSYTARKPIVLGATRSFGPSSWRRNLSRILYVFPNLAMSSWSYLRHRTSAPQKVWSSFGKFLPDLPSKGQWPLPQLGVPPLSSSLHPLPSPLLHQDTPPLAYIFEGTIGRFISLISIRAQYLEIWLIGWLLSLEDILWECKAQLKQKAKKERTLLLEE